jgi:CheY-like chemotaxis protein
VSGIVRGHKGAIHVTSAPGAGSAFRILMPVRAAQPTNDSEPDPAASAEQTACSGAILIVDDEDIVLRAAKAILEQCGFQALTAQSGPEAIDLYSQKRGEIEAILLDVSMPGMSGPETLSRLRAIDPDVDVTIASGHPEEHVRGLFGDQPVSGYVSKPFGWKRLAGALRRAVNAKRPR